MAVLAEAGGGRLRPGEPPGGHSAAPVWTGGGGTFNGFGDFDQIDANRTP